MKSLSASKYNYYNNSFSSPDKKLSRQTTSSTQKKDVLSVQSYLYEQAHLKEEASKKEIIRLIRSTIENIENKNADMKELNNQLSKLLLGLSSCINQQEISNYLIVLLQSIRDITQNNEKNQKSEFDKEKSQLLQKLQQLEAKTKENQQKLEMQCKEEQTQLKLKQYKEELQRIKKEKGVQKESVNRNELKSQIKIMQQKLVTMSEKEKKLIQLVKAVKSRGIDVEYIYKNLHQTSSKNSRISKEESSIENVESQHSNYADVSQFEIGMPILKRNAQYLID